MAKDGKLGTFAGVYTPSLLTILGVIMYMRMPWVVGNAGLYATLGIIAVAHVISVCTGLAISSIATDKRVGAGGAYYIISRSLGLPIGGTLGVALFLGLSFSISLYIIGFCESFLAYFGWEVGATQIRVAGTVVILLLTVVTFISTEFAIKTQYLIMTLIGLSLVSIFAGAAGSAPVSPALKPPDGGAPLALLFGIFFPAVTGFTAGVNMSGDLRNPRQSIPRGTMLAILSALGVYVGLSLFLLYYVPTDRLISTPDILLEVAWSRELVVGGAWGATLSSALGCILGAPRILQAVAKDRIGPRFLSKGYGKTNEPRNALVLAFAIGQAGILIAELDAIARIVSMVFLATYAFLNFSATIESWASPDFRPAFRIPRFVPIVGAATTILVMIQLDLIAMLGATLIMVGLFLYLKRKQLTLDSGDTWEGIWSSLVRSGLYRLSREKRQQRNWRPNILFFQKPQEAGNLPIHKIASSLITGSGILTEVELVDSRAAEAPGERPPEVESHVGVFRRRVFSSSQYETIDAVCRHYGFAGFEPNTVLMEWSAFRDDPDRFARMLTSLSALDFNLLLFAYDRTRGLGARRTIDIWWHRSAGNVLLSLALVRFITASSDWSGAKVRFLLVSDDSADNDNLRTTTRRLLTDARVEAGIRVLGGDIDDKSFYDRVREESAQTDLTLLGLPHDADELDAEHQAEMDRLFQTLGSVLLVRGSSAFKDVFVLGRQASISFLPPPVRDGEPAKLPELVLPPTPDIAREVTRFSESLQRVFGDFHEQCVKRLYGKNIELVRSVKRAAETHLLELHNALGAAGPRRKRQLIDRAQNAFLQECQDLFDKFKADGIGEQRSILEGRIESFLQDETIRAAGSAAQLLVERDRQDFKPQAGDSAYLRRFKRRRRWSAWLRRAPARYYIPVGALRAYYFDRACKEFLQTTVHQFITDSHQLMVRVGKLLNAAKTSLALATEDDREALATIVGEQAQNLGRHLDDLVRQHKERVSRHQWAALVGSRSLAEAYSQDANRLDVRPFTKKERRPVKEMAAVKAELAEIPGHWSHHQQLLLERAQLALTLASFQHRLASIVHQHKDTIALGIREGALRECKELRAILTPLCAALQGNGGPRPGPLRVNLDFNRGLDVNQVVGTLTREVGDSMRDLPESVSTLSDESLQHLEEGRTDQQAEVIELPVRRLVQFFVETEFLGGVQRQLSLILRAEQRANGVAQDVLRLVTFQISDLEAMEGAETGDFAELVRPVVARGLERLERELGELDALLPQVLQDVDQRLQQALDATNAYDLTSTSANLEQHIRLNQGRKAMFGVRSVVERTLASSRAALVHLVYRQSAGVVLARKLRRDAKLNGKLVDRVSTLVAESTPRPEVIERLPFYYRQLFLGHSSVNDSFWVGRQGQLAKAERAIQSFKRGRRGALLVSGERGSGKTALIQRIITESLDKSRILRIHPHPGGSIEPAAFSAALRKAADSTAEDDEIFESLEKHSVVVIDDLELWWERSTRGMAVVDHVRELIARHGHHVLFVLGIGRQALEFVNRLRPLSDQGLALLECGPLPAEQLKSIITLRHGSTGLRFELGEKREDELTQWRLARLFSSHFAYSGGWVGPALRSWILHVDEASEVSLKVRTPQTRQWELLDELRTEWVALLLQLLLHKQLSLPRLTRISALDARELKEQLDTLGRMGLITETRQGVVEINPYLQHVVVERLALRGFAA